MINSELLKASIADAKAVRATALANARASLEEAFAPRFEAMFAEKLKEESEEEGLQEVEAPNQVTGKGGEAKGPSTKAVSKGNPKQPNDSSTQFKAVKVGKGPTDVPNPSLKGLNETEEEDETKEEMDEQYEEGKVEEAGLTSEDLDEIIKELEDDIAGEEEGAPQLNQDPLAGVEGGEELPPADGGGELPPVATDDVGGEELPPMAGGDECSPCDDQQPSVEIPGEEEAGGMDAGGELPPPMVPTGEEGTEGDEEEEINLDELLSALNEESEEEDEEKEEMDESENHGLPKKGQESRATVKGYPKTGPEKTSPGSHQVTGKNHGGKIGTGTVGGLSENKYKVALKESYKTIEFLRGQINEVNLLNAKLLYTNKLFKEFAGVLDNSYRMKIVESFDLTKSIREVKLAYALLAESLNFGTQVNKVSSVKTVAKPVVQNTRVNRIAEGFASKPVSSTKPSQLITEGNAMALRFKKLAGIKETPQIITEKK